MLLRLESLVGNDALRWRRPGEFARAASRLLPDGKFLGFAFVFGHIGGENTPTNLGKCIILRFEALAIGSHRLIEKPVCSIRHTHPKDV